MKRSCPYCGEPIAMLIDASAGDADYIEDCPVCCRPIEVRLTVGPEGANLRLLTDNE